MISLAKWSSPADVESIRALVGVRAKFLAIDEGARLAAQGATVEHDLGHTLDPWLAGKPAPDRETLWSHRSKTR